MSYLNTLPKVKAYYKNYLEENSDLPEQLLHQMVVFALASRTNSPLMEELFGRPFSPAVKIHTSWFYWKAFEYSGLSSEWDSFVAARNQLTDTTNYHKILAERMKHQWPKDKSQLFTQRLGTSRSTLMTRARALPKKTSTSLSVQWTKGGVWSLYCPMTQMLLRNNPPTKREFTIGYRTLLSEESQQLLARELHYLIDPDQMLITEAYRKACDYARVRLASLFKNDGAHLKGRLPSWWTISWFFQTHIMSPNGKWYDIHKQFHTVSGKPLRPYLVLEKGLQDNFTDWFALPKRYRIQQKKAKNEL